MQKKRAVFLDRDGVINRQPPDHQYVKSAEEFAILPESLAAISFIRTRGYLVIVITNQRGIARGLMTRESVEQIHKKLENIDAFYICPHNYEEKCACRKPQPGLIKDAVIDFDIDLKESFMIGDSEIDYQAALNAGIPEKNVRIIPHNSSLLKIVKTLIL